MLLLLLGLIAWASIVAPMNAILAGWKAGPIPTDFAAVRLRWECGHMVVAALKLLALIMIAIAVAMPRHPSRG